MATSNIFDRLPSEAVRHIFQFLNDTPSLGRVASVCKRFYKISQEDEVWKAAYFARWNSYPAGYKLKNWKQIYRRKHLSEFNLYYFGIPNNFKRYQARPLLLPPGPRFASIYPGSTYNLALTHDGKLYSIRVNTSRGRHPLGGEEDEDEEEQQQQQEEGAPPPPKRESEEDVPQGEVKVFYNEMPAGPLRDERFVFVDIALDHAAAITEAGRLYSFRVSGLTKMPDTANIAPIEFFDPDKLNDRVVRAIPTDEIFGVSMFCILESGKVLALQRTLRYTVSEVEGLEDVKIVDMSVCTKSMSLSHVVALSDQGQVYTWGRDKRMLGYPPLDDQEQEEEGQNPLERILFQGNSRSGTLIRVRHLIANKVSTLSNVKIVKVACTTWNSWALDSDGRVYEWGMHSLTPVLVEFFRGVRVVDLSSGKIHIVFLTDSENGEVYTTGLGVLGHPDAYAIYPHPRLVTSLAGHCIYSLKAHGFNTFALTGDVFENPVAQPQVSFRVAPSTPLRVEWHRIVPTEGEVPIARIQPGAAAIDRKIYLLAAVGGFQRTGNNITLKESTVFVYDIDANSWEARKHSQDPVITNRAAFSLTAIDDTQLYLFAGCPDTDDFNDMWQYDTKANVWSAVAMSGRIPSPRDSFSANLIGNKLFVFGGCAGTNFFNDLYTFDLTTHVWEEHRVSGDRPSDRQGHSAVVRGTNIYIFGGDTGKQRVDNALYVLDTTTFTFRRFDLPGAPAPRSFHVCERIGKYMFVFGGMLGGGLSYRGDDLWCLDLDTLQWHEVFYRGEGPSGMVAGASTAIGNSIYIMGDLCNMLENGQNNMWRLDVYEN